MVMENFNGKMERSMLGSMSRTISRERDVTKAIGVIPTRVNSNTIKRMVKVHSDGPMERYT